MSLQIPPDHVLGPLAALGSSITWAIGTHYYARLSKFHPPWMINATRAIVALPCFFTVSLIVNENSLLFWERYFRIPLENWTWITVAMISSFALGDYIFLLSTRVLHPATALSIASIYPLWSALAGEFFFEQSLKLSQWIGVLVAIPGVVLVIRSRKFESETKNKSVESKIPNSKKSPVAVGFSLAFLASLAWALNSYAITKATAGIDLSIANTARMLVAFVLCLSFGLAMGQKHSSTTSLRQQFLSARKPLTSILWVFVLEGFVGSLFFSYGLKHSTMAMGAILSGIAPVVSIPIGFILFGVLPKIIEVVGILIVTIGIGLLAGIAVS